MAKKLLDVILRRGQDLTGRKFGRLTVVGIAGMSGKNSAWECVCDCGVIKNVCRCSLIQGCSKSCGCLSREMCAARSLTHGGKAERLYGIWKHIRERCNNKSCEAYGNYGGRGIEVCERWSDYANFRADMAASWEPGLTIDRRDNNGPYSPDNCRWATMKIQNRNRRNNRIIEFMGQSKCLVEWAEIYGLTEGSLYMRLRRGWPLERALTTPLGF